MRPSCLIIGALSEDHIILGKGLRRAIGGTAYYFSAAFVGLGGEARCATKTDERWMIDALRSAGIETDQVLQGTPCLFELTYDGSARSLRLLRDSSTILGGDIREESRNCQAVHLGPIERELDPSIRELADSFELSTLDVQGLARAITPDTGEMGLVRGLTPRLLEWTSSVQVVKMGEAEAGALLGDPSQWPDSAAAILGDGNLREIVITLGPKGSVLIDEDESVRIPPYPSDPVDWTGAGDCYMAGFVYRRLQGYGSVDSCHFGSALAACIIESERPIDFPSGDEVLCRMAQEPDE